MDFQSLALIIGFGLAVTKIVGIITHITISDMIMYTICNIGIFIFNILDNDVVTIGRNIRRWLRRIRSTITIRREQRTQRDLDEYRRDLELPITSERLIGEDEQYISINFSDIPIGTYFVITEESHDRCYRKMGPNSYVIYDDTVSPAGQYYSRADRHHILPFDVLIKVVNNLSTYTNIKLSDPPEIQEIENKRLITIE